TACLFVLNYFFQFRFVESYANVFVYSPIADSGKFPIRNMNFLKIAQRQSFLPVTCNRKFQPL
ncbi:MAG: hypothetical protein K2X47_19420, partial [Bdellovibrionales bacterium]|nr:hypothetical protein [Bdellovibrionales bacterium]